MASLRRLSGKPQLYISSFQPQIKLCNGHIAATAEQSTHKLKSKICSLSEHMMWLGQIHETSNVMASAFEPSENHSQERCHPATISGRTPEALPADQLNEIPDRMASLRRLSGKPQLDISSFQPQIKLRNGHIAATAEHSTHKLTSKICWLSERMMWLGQIHETSNVMASAFEPSENHSQERCHPATISGRTPEALPADQLNEIPDRMASLRRLSGKPQHYISSFQPQIKLCNGHIAATAEQSTHKLTSNICSLSEHMVWLGQIHETSNVMASALEPSENHSQERCHPATCRNPKALPADQLKEIPDRMASLRRLSGKPQLYISSLQQQVSLHNGHITISAAKTMRKGTSKCQRATHSLRV